MFDKSKTIVAAATATGGAISVIRISGAEAFAITETIFDRKLKDRIAVFGRILSQDTVIDEVIAVGYKSPRSYTGEDCVEVSCHGSAWITQEIIRLLIQAGAVAASAGEFTLRAFLAGKLDLSQAEAVADIIASNSRSAAQVAMQQMRGGYSEELRQMSVNLLDLLSLLELELDFGEEDVEFADRSQMRGMIEELLDKVVHLAASFRLGNVLKNGVPVAIVGKPNVGKSTLLNRLLGEERAIVSPVAGTTRDFIEETLVVDGIMFRFIDTAGLRDSQDEIERIGIERSYEKLRTASIVIHLLDSIDDTESIELSSEQKLITVLNKADINVSDRTDLFSISAKYGDGIDELKRILVHATGISDYDTNAICVSNARHYEALEQSRKAFFRTLEALDVNLPTDLISAEIRTALSHLHEITGEITTDDILGNIFSKFCIGK